MANGKITWAAPTFKALSLDGAHYLTLADPNFALGIESSGVDILFRVDLDSPTNRFYICGQGALDLSNAAGWHLYGYRDTGKLELELNDGAATATVITSEEWVLEIGDFTWGGFSLDRDNGLVQFYGRGAAVGAAQAAVILASIDNVEPFRAGGDGVSSYFKGALGGLRIDRGRVLPAVWYAREWERLRYGEQPRPGLNFLERWNFGETLVGEQGYTLVWQGGGSPAYTTGYPSGTISYTLEENYLFGHRAPYLDGPGLIRMLDGSAASYDPGWRKRRLFWEFDNIPPGQVTALMAADQARTPVTFYPDEALPPLFTGLFVPGMEFEEKFLNLWSGDIEAEES